MSALGENSRDRGVGFPWPNPCVNDRSVLQ